MSLIALSLLLAAAAPVPNLGSKPVAVQTHAIASVQIVAGEEIRFEGVSKAEPKTTQRQERVRDGMPMVEFY